MRRKCLCLPPCWLRETGARLELVFHIHQWGECKQRREPINTRLPGRGNDVCVFLSLFILVNERESFIRLGNVNSDERKRAVASYVPAKFNRHYATKRGGQMALDTAWHIVHVNARRVSWRPPFEAVTDYCQQGQREMELGTVMSVYEEWYYSLCQRIVSKRCVTFKSKGNECYGWVYTKKERKGGGDERNGGLIYEERRSLLLSLFTINIYGKKCRPGVK